MEPELAQFESAHSKKLNFVNVNVDSEKSKLDKYPQVQAELDKQGGIPLTVLVDKQGKPVEVWLGFKSKKELEAACAKYLK